jgi:hypothetical protein
MTMILHVEGATREELERGLAAARAIFEAADISPWAAALAHHAREGWDVGGFADELELTSEQHAAAAVLDDARAAAVEACCAGWSVPLPAAELSISHPRS